MKETEYTQLPIPSVEYSIRLEVKTKIESKYQLNPLLVSQLYRALSSGTVVDINRKALLLFEGEAFLSQKLSQLGSSPITFSKCEHPGLSISVYVLSQKVFAYLSRITRLNRE